MVKTTYNISSVELLTDIHFNLKENKLLCIDTFCVIEINYLLFVCSVY